MKKIFTILSMVGLALLASACASSTIEQVAPTMQSETNQGNNPSGMDMSVNMMERHHAPIPEAYGGLINPVVADEASLARGAEIYATHCATCHGDGGMGDGPDAESLNPAPAAIAHTSQMLGDDYQFWRVSEGGAMEPFNSGMIAWKDILDEQSRWDVINYVQALSHGEVMPVRNMGGRPFDAAAGAASQAQMLADGVEQGVMTEEEAAVFAAAREKVDQLMIQGRAEGVTGSTDDLMADILVELVTANALTQEQADTFLSVSDRLGKAGLMR